MSDCANISNCCPPGPFDAVSPPGQLTLYWNTEQSYTANCPEGCTGGPFTYTIPANTYSSTVSQSDANTQAYNAAVAAANAELSNCVPPAYLNTIQSYTTYCPAGTTGGPFTATIAAGTYTSLVSQADADSQALAAAIAEATDDLSGCTSSVIEGQLDGLMWLMPCQNDHLPCSCFNPSPQSVTLQGDPNHTYQVTLRFRGVVEQQSYTGGSASGQDGHFYLDAVVPSPNVANTYKLQVSDPAHTYYLNNTVVESPWCIAIDYQVTIPMKGGSVVTITADAGDSLEVPNKDGLLVSNSPALTNNVQGADGTTPYNGQFICMTVISVNY